MKLLVVLCTMLSASAFNPLGAVRVQKMQMAAEKPSMQKLLGVALVASSMFAGPVLAKEGAGANIEIFGNNGASSPFSDAKTYSPYSPYGDGTNAVYNGRKGSPEETKFWTEKFNECM